jgi:hypothetical protein
MEALLKAHSLPREQFIQSARHEYCGFFPLALAFALNRWEPVWMRHLMALEELSSIVKSA